MTLRTCPRSSAKDTPSTAAGRKRRRRAIFAATMAAAIRTAIVASVDRRRAVATGVGPTLCRPRQRYGGGRRKVFGRQQKRSTVSAIQSCCFPLECELGFSARDLKPPSAATRPINQDGHSSHTIPFWRSDVSLSMISFPLTTVTASLTLGDAVVSL